MKIKHLVFIYKTFYFNHLKYPTFYKTIYTK
jgi:hypothetical protein